jgi:1-acyl-sn-glycerol-3-phosphate acyltransferase
MAWGWLLAAALGAVALLVGVWAAGRWMARSPRRDPFSLLMIVVLGVVVRVVHATRYCGRELIPKADGPGPSGRRPEGGALLVVANHTAGLDPLLIQQVCPFFVRWMMWQNMRVGSLEPLWRWLKILFVGGGRAQDLATMREALRELERGGAVGIFPEGGIARPPRTIQRFRGGVGVLVSKSGARVLPVVIEGPAKARHAFVSLFIPARSRVRVMPIIDYRGVDADQIAEDLEARFAAWTGWPRQRRGGGERGEASGESAGEGAAGEGERGGKGGNGGRAG